MNTNVRRPFWTRSAKSGPMTFEGGLSYRVLKRDFDGVMGTLQAYVVSLEFGCQPHEVHNHVEEEIFFPLSGSVELRLPGNKTFGVGMGQVVFQSTGHQHTYCGTSSPPPEIVVLKWTPPGITTPPADNIFLVADTDAESGTWTEDGGIRRRVIWDRILLAAGGHLEAEVLEMAPMTGHPRRSDEYDKLLVLTHGRLTGLGHVTEAPGLIYYPAGTPHAAAPTNPDPIRMLAFHFHPPEIQP